MAEIPYDEMRRILGLPDVRDEVMRMRAVAGRDRGVYALREHWGEALDAVETGAPYQPHRRFERGDRVAWGTSEGVRGISVVVDVVENGDDVKYTLEDPRYSTRAQVLALIRDRGRRGDPIGPCTAAMINVLALFQDKARPSMGAAKNPYAAVERFQAFSDRFNDLVAAAAMPVVPTTVFPPKPKPVAGPRIPRPSHTPPMWAPDPARTRRSKNGGVDMRTPRV